MTPGFWHGRRVFLTGHTGFKGGWLSLWLHRLGARVTGYAMPPPTTPNLFTVARVGDVLENSVIADIRDLPRLQQAMTAARPEIVIHMAAQPLVRASYADPVATYSTNVMGTINVLEAARHTPGVGAVLNVTTDKCYDNREWVWGYREDEPMGGRDPYSSSKACAELVSAAYRASYFGAHGHRPVALATARAGNVIGGGDWAADRLVPDILAAFASGRAVSIRNPAATRPWQHVLEPLGGYLQLAERLVLDGASHAEAWNFGPRDDDVQPVAWIADTLARMWGADARWTQDPASHPHEAASLKLDISKARKRLRWHPALDLAKALELAVDWVRAMHRGADMHHHTLAQIQDYQNLLADRNPHGK